MAIRKIITEDDQTLYKVSRPVTEFNERLWQLIDDMKDTLKKADGVGLAAPQVGVLRRLFIIDMGEDGVVEVINPEIIEKKGKQEDVEGCLSCPGEYGITCRPNFVKIKAQDRYGKEYTLDGEGLSARCICHENDHLEGIIFKKHVIRMLDPDELIG
ncbi:MAG: peptide deformylase [Oscillospiraceae bacterium]|nr:peptide deformylase [Oscillospiraceae bacterium]MDD4413895.1 peptide deformylase [Oscillospiraceae bacterium]